MLRYFLVCEGIVQCDRPEQAALPDESCFELTPMEAYELVLQGTKLFGNPS